MKTKDFVVEGLVAFVVTLIVSVVVTFLWNLIGHSTGSIDWETSFRTATVFAVIVPLIGRRRRA